ncbi:phage holin family protein [Ruminiclostridium cellobioparum]|uniref:phage holin family protein n=1 Tax=Ruminiclostridium cellobioparum TaxID=29355 RepID=UPI0028AA20CF|nr:phage holin family protein [Ruminiclostridium cellobioparum]
MENNINAFKVSLTAVFTAITAGFGWFGWLVVIFIASMTGDLLTGFMAAFKCGNWESKIAREGLWHKTGCIIAVLVTAIFDSILAMIINNIPNVDFPFKYTVMLCPLTMTWYILTELGSIIENAGKMGAPVPGFVKQALALFKGAVDSAGDKATGDN